MVTPKSSGPTTGRPEHPNTEEADKNDLKYNFMKMIETLKERMKSSLKEMEEKTNKKLEEITKSLKETHEKPRGKTTSTGKASSSNSSRLEN